jgi:uncharacterized protein (TIGR02646 family)
VPPPATLSGNEVVVALAQAEEHFRSDDSASRQKKFRFDPLYRKEEVLDALHRVFHDKCAFCESRLEIAAAAPITHHWRPIQEAVDVDGTVSRGHYWWLAYEWENIYLSCQRCATAAGSQFPVERTRASAGTLDLSLLDEDPLLLDPCRDDPTVHLDFLPDGSVRSVSKRGMHTIAIYSLNRAALVSARRQAIDAAVRSRWRAPTLDPSTPYLGAIRQVLGGERPELGLARRVQMRLLSRTPVLGNRVLSKPAVAPALVERLQLRDFRGIERLSLDLAGPDDPAPWTMLLGENGHGKTSVLQALALLLMGEESRRRLRIPASAFVREGCDFGEVVAHVRGSLQPRVLRIHHYGFQPDSFDAPAALAAYGAARIPPSRHRSSRWRRNSPRVANLFEPATPLTAAETWLGELDPHSFDFAGRALRRLLLAPEDTVVEMRERGVVLRTSARAEHLSQLSDGYRSMVALAADIMSFFMTRYGSMDAAEGIVLVDELSAHLHPRWQMRVVEAFREAFPRLQFVATTHDPLCLRGLDGDREVVVLRRSKADEIYALPPTEIPAVSGLRVDELLTSEIFGLSSTIDPELERDFNRYYELLRVLEPDPGALRELTGLRERLAEFRQLGTTRRERLALEAADEYIAREPDVTESHARAELLDSTKKRLRGIWLGDDD